MRRLALFLALTLIPLAIPPAAGAAEVVETDSAGATTATFSYDARENRFGLMTYSNLHVTIDRAGARLVDQDIRDDCENCLLWPAAAGAVDAKSVRVRDLDNDGEPEVLVDLYTGGANCCWLSDSWRYDAGRNVYVEKRLMPGRSFPYTLRDLNKDGSPEFKTYDYRFAYKYGSGADTPRPLRILQWNHGRLFDATLGYPQLAAREAARLYRTYLRLRKRDDVNLRGVLAAYVADSYNAGRGRVAWRRLVAAYRRGDVDKKFDGDAGPHGRRYLKSLRRFLRKLKYLQAQ